MKWIILIPILMLSAHARIELHSDYQDVPLYLREFLTKMGIQPDAFDKDERLIASIRKAVLAMGFEVTRSNATAAKDELSGCRYFKITEDTKAVIIERRYPLTTEFREPALYLIKDEHGRFIEVSFINTLISRGTIPRK